MVLEFWSKLRKFESNIIVMETVLINVDKKSDITFLMNLAKKLGMSAKALSHSEVEDWKLAQKIEAGMKTSSVSRSEVMKALGK
jgi:hypothetical protein